MTILNRKSGIDITNNKCDEYGACRTNIQLISSVYRFHISHRTKKVLKYYNSRQKTDKSQIQVLSKTTVVGIHLFKSAFRSSKLSFLKKILL